MTPKPAPPIAAPVARRSLVDEVVDALALPILRDELAPGQTLPAERALAEQLGVRRGALREGIQRLQQAGLVEVRHGGGTTVRDWRRHAGLEALPMLLVGPDGRPNGDVLMSVLEMRSALAPDLARQAARRRHDEHTARLRAHLDAMSAPGCSDAERAASAAALWDTIVDASGNIAYRLAYNALLRVADLGGDWVLRVLASERSRLDVHADLVEAIARGDTERAGDAARALTLLGERAFERALGDATSTADSLPPNPPAPPAHSEPSS
jgi:DNA-binding FadR family transcriptional regulator